jgi:hypothetical protein
MATVKISQLPPAPVPLLGADLVPVVQSGTTVRTTLDNVGSYINASVKTFGAVGDGGVALRMGITVLFSVFRQRLFSRWHSWFSIWASYFRWWVIFVWHNLA